MGATVTGMKEWLDVLRTVEERADKVFKPIMSKAGANMKDDWSGRWQAMAHRHIPHLVRKSSFQYEVTKKGNTYTTELGVRAGTLQGRLASFIEFGTLTSGPHPGGEPALQAEVPRMSQYAEDAAAQLLEGQT